MVGKSYLLIFCGTVPTTSYLYAPVHPPHRTAYKCCI